MLKKIASEIIKLSKKIPSDISSITKIDKSSKVNLPEVIKSLEKVPLHVTDGITSVFNEITGYLKIAAIEETKRTDITARRDIALQALKNQRATFEQLMQYTFQERASVIQKQFDVLDFAMANGNVDTIKNALDGMVAVIQTSPFKSIQEMQTALGSKDFVVRLE
jgi:hypothetical protein